MCCSGLLCVVEIVLQCIAVCVAVCVIVCCVPQVKLNKVYSLSFSSRVFSSDAFFHKRVQRLRKQKMCGSRYSHVYMFLL